MPHGVRVAEILIYLYLYCLNNLTFCLYCKDRLGEMGTSVFLSLTNWCKLYNKFHGLAGEGCRYIYM